MLFFLIQKVREVYIFIKMIEYHIIILDFGETEIAIKGEESHFCYKFWIGNIFNFFQTIKNIHKWK